MLPRNTRARPFNLLGFNKRICSRLTSFTSRNREHRQARANPFVNTRSSFHRRPNSQRAPSAVGRGVPRDPTRCAVGFPTVSMFKVRPKDKVVLESCLGCFLLPRNPAILLRLGGARHQAQRERSPFANRRSSKMPAGTDPSRAAVNHRHTNRKAFRHQTSDIGVPLARTRAQTTNNMSLRGH